MAVLESLYSESGSIHDNAIAGALLEILDRLKALEERLGPLEDWTRRQDLMVEQQEKLAMQQAEDAHQARLHQNLTRALNSGEF
jgi:hypothetical protein